MYDSCAKHLIASVRPALSLPLHGGMGEALCRDGMIDKATCNTEFSYGRKPSWEQLSCCKLCMH